MVNKIQVHTNTSLINITEYIDGVLCEETWRDIEGYEGHYKISSMGRVKSLERKVQHGKSGFITMPTRILKQKLRKDGYTEVNLSKDGVHKMKSTHILVAKHFISNPLNLPEVNHINGVKTDSRVHQLEWVTSSQNQEHSYKVLNRCSTVGYGDKNPNFGNFKLYLNLLTGIYYTLQDLSDMYGINPKSVRGLFYRNKNDNRISNLIKV